MSLKERIYSVLIVSAAEKLNNALSSTLHEPKYHPVTFVSSTAAARNAFGEKEYDFVIINSPLPDGQGIRLAIDLCSTNGTVVLLLVRPEVYEEIREKTADHGVFTLVRPITRNSLNMALEWMSGTRERLRKIERKTISVEEKMTEIRAINRAKWTLITELKMDEPSAHRYIEKQAMDRCITKREVAEEIINIYT